MGSHGGGFVSTAIFVGLVAVLIWFCCRAKRKGAVLRAPNADFNGGVVTVTQEVHPQGMMTTGYPYGQPAQTYPQQQSGIYSPNQVPYGGYPFGTNATNVPYPTHSSGMPMPMPQFANHGVQQSAPYPTGPTAPMADDLPPPYESVVKQQQ